MKSNNATPLIEIEIIEGEEDEEDMIEADFNQNQDQNDDNSQGQP